MEDGRVMLASLMAAIEGEPYDFADVCCAHCGNTWIAILPVNIRMIECPECRRMTPAPEVDNR